MRWLFPPSRKQPRLLSKIFKFNLHGNFAKESGFRAYNNLYFYIQLWVRACNHVYIDIYMYNFSRTHETALNPGPRVFYHKADEGEVKGNELKKKVLKKYDTINLSIIIQFIDHFI